MNKTAVIENKLLNLGLRLEAPKPAVANYLGSKRVDGLLFVSGRKSELTGEVGTDITEEQAKDAARKTVVLILAIIKEDIKNLDLIEGVVKLQGFIRSSANFTRQPQVLDGASELLIALFGDNGPHARTATGVAQLPFGATIQLDMILKIKTT
jgi:enamine deaminase RidA (YjgF/YER057c/UK114 family)